MSKCCAVLSNSRPLPQVFPFFPRDHKPSIAGAMKLLYLILPLISLPADSHQLLGRSPLPDENVSFLSHPSSKPSLDEYLVLFKPHTKPETVDAHHAWVRELCRLAHVNYSDPIRTKQALLDDRNLYRVTHTYNISSGFLGYSAWFNGRIISEIYHHADVR